MAGLLLSMIYLVALGAEFFAPYDYTRDNVRLRYVAPQMIHLLWRGHHLLLGVYGLQQTRDQQTLEIKYRPDPTHTYPISFFCHGDPYRLFGLFHSDVHLFSSSGPMFLAGTDRMGRDILSRTIEGGRVSLTIGLLSVALSITIGTFFGMISGYFGGIVDLILQRLIEMLTAFPTLPLLMALAAIVPQTWSTIQVYFCITLLLALTNWGRLARQVRGKVLAIRNLDYVTAARAAGAGTWHILTWHLLPGVRSHVIIVATLSIPTMILGETALSFLGLGIRPPLTSWGVLLEEAQRITVLLEYPWLLTPALMIIVTVIAFNVIGDALRDAADPNSG